MKQKVRAFLTRFRGVFPFAKLVWSNRKAEASGVVALVALVRTFLH